MSAIFRLESKYTPTGDQPNAIEKLSTGVLSGLKNQVLLGVTGSGKTYTMAQVIAHLNKPALIISHNKTLAGQLYQEFRDFFPDNAVSYFVSYYDYYQPEAYIPSSNTYIEKESQINDLIDKLRLQSTANILTRRDCIIVASVSCIYNIGDPKSWGEFMAVVKTGDRADWFALAKRLVELLYTRSEFEFKRGSFRIRGTYMDVYPAYEDFCYRILTHEGVISGFQIINPQTGEEIKNHPLSGRTGANAIIIYPAKHNLTTRASFDAAYDQIKSDLLAESSALQKAGKLLEAQRLQQKVTYDLEILKEVGYVNGIENYSRYFDGRRIGEAPFSLIDYFHQAYGDDFLVFVDESHMSIPQIRGMFNGDYSRKKTLVDYGFRLKSAFDNRPLKFEEFYPKVPNFIFVSATPNEWELQMAAAENAESDREYKGVVEQLVRPTGIIDPQIIVRPATTEIPDVIAEIEKRVALGERTLVTTLTKKQAEDLTTYLKDRNIKAAYLHSDVQTLERSDVLDSLRNKTFDVLIGVNLLREGLDLPEVTLVAILDADREGFLRSRTSLVQTMGRAARNIRGEVILYADRITDSMEYAISEITRRRLYQEEYNTRHGITPANIQKAIKEKIAEKQESDSDRMAAQTLKSDKFNYKYLSDLQEESLTPFDKARLIKDLEREMKRRAQDMDFEAAIALRDKIKNLKDS